MDRSQRLFLYVSGLFVTSLVVADIIGSKFFTFGPYGSPFGSGTWSVTHSVGMLPFPITFLLTDLVNEYWGKKVARQLTIFGLVMAAFAFVMIRIARGMPVASFSPISQEHFDAVFAMSNRLYIASLSAFALGQLVDIQAFTLLKRVTRGRFIWLRATGSTLVSQAVDSLMVSFVLMWGTTLSNGEIASTGLILETAATGYVLKFCIALAITPLIYLGHGVMQRWFGLTPLPAEAAETVEERP